MNNKGFSLVELLVICAFIAILSTIFLVSGNVIREKSRMSKAKSFDSEVYLKLGYDLVGEWTFEDSNNLGKDTSGYFRHGELKGNLAANGGFNSTYNSLSFDGNDCVQIDKTFESKNLTVSVWVYPTTDGSSAVYRIVSRDRSDYWMLGQAESNRIEWSLILSDPNPGGDGGNDLTDPDSLKKDKWNHIAATYDSSTSYKTVYVDGVKIKSWNTGVNPEDFVIIGDQAASVPIGIGENMEESLGGCDNSATYGFRGRIDDVRIYRDALTLAKIQDIYKQDLEKYSELAFNN